MSYGLLFQCDPMAFLDRPAEDLPVLLTLIDVADRRIKKHYEEAKRG